MKIIKFGASWCGPCRIQDKILNELVDEGYEVEFVNIDEQEEKAYVHDVHSLPTTIILDDENKEVRRFIGLAQKKELLEVLQ